MLKTQIIPNPVMPHLVTFITTFALASTAAASCLEPETPIGPITTFEGYTAFYDGATERYAHGVLGDAIEGSVLRLIAEGGDEPCGWSVILDEAHVFEDLAPRLADLDGDAIPELITVRAHRDQGAQLAIYELGPDGLALLTATPYIGTRNRWLAPIGAADLDGDGYLEIGFIDRPHLAKTLRVWRFRERRLELVASLAGLTNHKIGEDFITSGVRNCGDRPQLVMADSWWESIIAVELTVDGDLESRRLADFEGLSSLERQLIC